MTPPGDHVTRLMDAASGGDNAAAAELLPLVYDELRRVARKKMAFERPSHTLGATALVHEAYVRLVGPADPADGKPDARAYSNRAHFFHAAAEAMRRILIDHARGRGRVKRAGGRRRVPIDALDLAAEGDFEDVVALDEAVTRLEAEEPDVAKVVRLRFYAGLSIAETAAVLGVTSRTVNRDWAYARAYLLDALGGPPGPDDPRRGNGG
jgi:RNA polymerase sigma factor (TIGR02999 family)